MNSGRFCVLVLVEQHEVVKDAHHRRDRRDRRLLVDRHARRAARAREPGLPRAREPQDATTLLRARPGWPAESAKTSEPAAMQRKYCFTGLLADRCKRREHFMTAPKRGRAICNCEE